MSVVTPTLTSRHVARRTRSRSATSRACSASTTRKQPGAADSYHVRPVVRKDRFANSTSPPPSSHGICVLSVTSTLRIPPRRRAHRNAARTTSRISFGPSPRKQSDRFWIPCKTARRVTRFTRKKKHSGLCVPPSPPPYTATMSVGRPSSPRDMFTSATVRIWISRPSVRCVTLSPPPSCLNRSGISAGRPSQNLTSCQSSWRGKGTLATTDIRPLSLIYILAP